MGRLGWGIVAALWVGLPAVAGPVTEAAEAIEAKLAAGDAVAALEAARGLFAQVWDKSPALTFGAGLVGQRKCHGVWRVQPARRQCVQEGRSDPDLCRALWVWLWQSRGGAVVGQFHR